jgi:hypothetical protein
MLQITIHKYGVNMFLVLDWPKIVSNGSFSIRGAELSRYDCRPYTGWLYST